MKTVAFVSMTNGRPAVTTDRARATQYAADTRGTVEELVLRSEAEAALTPWRELHRAVAEMLGTTPEAWPDHGNAPLAIAATVARLLQLERAGTVAKPFGGAHEHQDGAN